jgi:hypothetical protein
MLDLMSKTAKKDVTPEPPEAVATDSAATGEKPEAAQVPEQAMDADASDLDETKRKFREALERKHQAHGDSQGKGGKDGGKISGAHGPAASRRNFRRKSG